MDQPAQPPKAPPSSAGAQRPAWLGWILLGLMLTSFWSWDYFGRAKPEPVISYTAFHQALVDQHVAKVVIKGQSVSGELRAALDVEGQKILTFQTILPVQEDPEFLALLRARGVEVTVKLEGQSLALQVVLSLLPFALIIAIGTWFSRQARSMAGPGGPLGMLRARSRRVEKQTEVSIRFDDVAGLKAAKQDLQEIVQYLK
jgi:cell division protease FtsH